MRHLRRVAVAGQGTNILIYLFLGKKWFDNNKGNQNELFGWLDPGLDIFQSDIDEDGILADDDTTMVSSSHPLVEGINFDGFPAISKTPNGHVLYFISIGPGQEVPQLWQMDMPKGDNKKQVFSKNK
jgi:hypothetical protein